MALWSEGYFTDTEFYTDVFTGAFSMPGHDYRGYCHVFCAETGNRLDYLCHSPYSGGGYRGDYDRQCTPVYQNAAAD